MRKNVLTKSPRIDDSPPGCMVNPSQKPNEQRKYTVTYYREHIQALAGQHNIKIILKEKTRARAWRATRTVRFSPIKTGVSYCMALHELGHIQGRQGKNRIDKEVNAWQWAHANAIEWTPTMQKAVARCLSSYVRWAERSKRAVKPDNNHEIYQWIGA